MIPALKVDQVRQDYIQNKIMTDAKRVVHDIDEIIQRGKNHMTFYRFSEYDLPFRYLKDNFVRDAVSKLYTDAGWDIQIDARWWKITIYLNSKNEWE